MVFVDDKPTFALQVDSNREIRTSHCGWARGLCLPQLMSGRWSLKQGRVLEIHGQHQKVDMIPTCVQSLRLQCLLWSASVALH